MGAAAQTLTINGTGFIPTSTVTYNAVPHAVSYFSSTLLTITLSLIDQATAGTFAVVVTNPAPGGGISNSVNFTVTNLAPTITSISPSSAMEGTAAQTLTIIGTNFLSTSTVTYNKVTHGAAFMRSDEVNHHAERERPGYRRNLRRCSDQSCTGRRCFERCHFYGQQPGTHGRFAFALECVRRARQPSR